MGRNRQSSICWFIHQMPPMAALRSLAVSNYGFNPSLQHGCQGPKNVGYYVLPSKVPINRKVQLRAELGFTLSEALWGIHTHRHTHLPSVDSLPKWPQMPWLRLKHGVSSRTPIHVQGPEQLLFQAHKQGVGLEMEEQGNKLITICESHRWQINLLCHYVSLQKYLSLINTSESFFFFFWKKRNFITRWSLKSVRHFMWARCYVGK